MFPDVSFDDDEDLFHGASQDGNSSAQFGCCSGLIVIATGLTCSFLLK